MDDSNPPEPRGSRIISRLLPPAIRLWLLSQLDHVEDLVFKVEGRDRDILSGHIPEVFLSANKAIYQGIHLSQVAVTAREISINLGQVIRRRPLRLLKAFPLDGTVLLTTDDFNRSLQAPLLGEGLYDLLRLLSHSQSEVAGLKEILNTLPGRTISPTYHPMARIDADGIMLHLTPAKGETVPPVKLITQLGIKNGRCLCLQHPRWSTDPDGDRTDPLHELHGFEIDLGSEVALTTCILQAGQLALAGTVQVLPEKT